MANKDTIICDTNILAYFFEGNKGVAKLIGSSYILLSAITHIEILSNKKIPVAERVVIEDFLKSFQIIETNPVINKLAIQFRLLYNLDTPDSIIVATAKYYDIKLVTADKQFYKIKEITITPFSK